MMGWLSSFLSDDSFGLVILIFIAAGIVIAFAKGWLMTPFQVRSLTEIQNLRISESNKRADDWQDAYAKQTTALGIALDQLDRLKVVGDATNRVLSALPSPPVQGADERVDS